MAKKQIGFSLRIPDTDYTSQNKSHKMILDHVLIKQIKSNSEIQLNLQRLPL